MQTLITEPGLEITAEQFRPNIVISGVKSDDEDDMRECKLVSQDVTLRVIKHCVRCKTPNFNKSKGVSNESNEPLKTLTNYKLHPMIGVVFGQYLSADKDCEIKIGKFNSLNHIHFYR